jgi:hypothetical protein
MKNDGKKSFKKIKNKNHETRIHVNFINWSQFFKPVNH